MGARPRHSRIGWKFRVGGQMTSIYCGNTKAGPTRGLAARIYPPFIQGPGYHDWMVEVFRADGLPFPVDEEITLRIYFNYEDKGPCIEQRILMEQGKPKAFYQIRGACWSYPQVWSCRFLMNQRELKGLSLSGHAFNNAYLRSDMNSLFVIGGKGFDAAAYLETYQGQFAAVLKEYEKCPQWSVILNGPNNTRGMALGTMSPNMASVIRLPEDWLGISRFSEIVIPREALEELTPGQRDAIRTYVRAGGMVTVTRCEMVENSTQGNAFIVNQKEITQRLLNLDLNELSWDILPKKTMVRGDLGFGHLILNAQMNLQEELKETNTNVAAPGAVTYTVPAVVQSNVALSTGKKPVTTAKTVRTIGGRESWGSLRGISVDFGAGINFWNWLIPNVGKPPIWGFVTCIILFAGIAGPALARFSIKARRPAWLLILFPLLAFFVTFLIGAYAVLHDGFRTNSRIRSLTHYDPIRQEGFAWSRQTYFSGSPPSEGMSFRRDTELTPFSWRDEYQAYRPSSSYRQQWEEKQRFSGLLTHREQKQFLVRHPMRDWKPFEIVKEAATEAPESIHNRTSEAFLHVIVVDADGECHYASAVPPNQQAKLVTTPKSDLLKILLAAAAKSEPIIPEGLSQGQQVSVLDWWNGRSSLAGWTTFDPLMETELSDWFTGNNLLPKTFLIILEKAEHLDRGLQGNESDSIHVMVGAW